MVNEQREVGELTSGTFADDSAQVVQNAAFMVRHEAI